MWESLSCFKDKDLGGKYSKSNCILLTLFFAVTVIITHGWLLFTHAGWIIYDIHMTYDLQFTNHSRNWFCTEQLSVNRYTIAQLMGTYHLLMINYLKLWNNIFQCYSQAASDWWCKGVEVSVRNNMLLFMCNFIQFKWDWLTNLFYLWCCLWLIYSLFVINILTKYCKSNHYDFFLLFGLSYVWNTSLVVSTAGHCVISFMSLSFDLFILNSFNLTTVLQFSNT